MIRIQLDLPKEQVKELDELMKETKLATRKDLFNNALTLFQWAVKAKRGGRIIASVDEAGRTSKELVMPALENVSPRVPIYDGAPLAGSVRILGEDEKDSRANAKSVPG